jgi:hypothetical protein
MTMFKQPLTRCPGCKLNAVVPLMDECAQFSEPYKGWHMVLRCVACHTVREVLVSQATAEAFDRALDAEAASLRYALAQLEHEHMQEHIERFAAALDADAILPEDFCV